MDKSDHCEAEKMSSSLTTTGHTTTLESCTPSDIGLTNSVHHDHGHGELPDDKVIITDDHDYKNHDEELVSLQEADGSSQEDEDDDVDDSGDDSGDECDVEDNIEQIPFPGTYVRRLPNPDLPDTVTTLHTDEGSKVYVVGTAHFSKNSQDDVAKTIQLTQPDVVMVELCSSRVGILQLDEQKLLEEAKNINFEKFRTLVKQAGMIQGVVHILLLSMSAHLTEQLGMAPGGEFRQAFREAQKIPGCRIHLGDRPVGITLRRAVHSLSLRQKLQLMWCLITSKDPISKEEVEKCKQRDLLEEMMREMAGEFPALSRVFVEERDQFLVHSLRAAARLVPNPNSSEGVMAPVVVGVVGIGHVQGIVNNWHETFNIQDILSVPESSGASKIVKWTIRAGLIGLVSWGCIKIYHRLPLPRLKFL